MRGVVAAAVLLGMCSGLAGADAASADDGPRPERGTISFLFENDIFYRTDRDYTNGVLLAWTSAPADTPDFAVRWARALPFFAQSGEVRTSVALGQDIYTPDNIKLANPPPGARPYAGFLYANFGLIDKTESRLDQLQLTLGVVGPDSLAEETQKFVHKLLGDQTPEGWRTQLRNEPGVVLTYERSWKLIPPRSFAGLLFDVEPHAGAAVGNVYDYVNAGAMARIGFPLPDDYGPLRIEPSLPGSNFFEPAGQFGIYAFVGVDGRAVARNLFLDGNTWTASRHVDKNVFVGDLQLGAAITTRSWRLTFTHVFRTKEFCTQKNSDQFGAINLSIRY
ncbi:MAG TPA: lipid A deacylase LpxR family protein [Rhizomicrobium sp.]|nr:lipid A deacylase LpxR family protein [Rhizomicrobium sp.]